VKEAMFEHVVEHVIPIAMGEMNFIDTIQPLCLSCNTSKKAKIIEYRERGE